jgi:hypothetical protein
LLRGKARKIKPSISLRYARAYDLFAMLIAWLISNSGPASDGLGGERLQTEGLVANHAASSG